MEPGKSYRHKEQRCLKCSHDLSGAFCIDGDHAPEPNDLSLCIKCGHLMAFDDDMNFRELTFEEQQEAFGDISIVTAIRAINAAGPGTGDG